MTFDDFEQSWRTGMRPPGLSPELIALWHDGRGEWDAAHEAVQESSTKSAALVHAYLHRKEGDRVNARYWYSTAGRSVPKISLDDEWRALVEEFLSNAATGS